MKTNLIISAFLAGSLSAHSQGSLMFQDRMSDMTMHIFAPQLQTPSAEVTGDQGLATGAAAGGVTADLYANNGTDGNYAGGSNPGAGTTGSFTTGGIAVYTGGAIGNTSLGNPTPAGAYNYNNGADYTVELYAAVGANQPLTALQPVSQYATTIFTSSLNGGAFRNLIPSQPDPGIPNTGDDINTVVTIALCVWYNGGTGLTYAQAVAAGDPWGISPRDNLNDLYTGGPGVPPIMEGLESFSLSVVPEPCTIALGVVGASVFLFRRRKAV